MKTLAFDTETYPIGLVVPRGAKRAKCNRNAAPRMVCLTSYDGATARIERGEQAVTHFLDAIQDPTTALVGHNLSFDLGVMARAAKEVCAIDAVPDIFAAFEDFRFHADGRMHDTQLRELLVDVGTAGIADRKSYALSSLVKNHLGVDISASKSGPDVWRLRYNELDPLPTEQWPPAAREYALDDARLTYGVYCAQQNPVYSAIDTPLAGSKGVENEALQVRSDWCLQLMTIWGLRVDEAFARALDDQFVSVRERLGEKLGKWGLVRKNGSEDRAEIQRLYADAFTQVGLEPPRTSKGAISTSAESRQMLTEAGFSDARFDTLVEYTRIGKFRSTYMEPILMAPPYALCPRYGFVSSGRTSSSGPNIQNFPKKDRATDAIRASDVRRCFVPREGNVFVNADYSTLELRTLAQVNLNLGLHHCHMAEVLQAGRDLHTDFAAQLLSTTYEDAVARLAAGEELVERMRALAKVANFGFPGGLQPSGFRLFARGYGILISEAEAEELYQHWMRRWSEMEVFFDHVHQHEQWDGSVPIQQHAPHGNKGNWRVRVCSSVPAACNTLFQGLAADGAKMAMWDIWKACYVEKESPLYGFRPNAFIHDEFLLEGPERRATAAADELVRLMCVGMKAMVPDIPIEADAAVGRRWDPKMKSTRKEDGTLTIYEG